LQTKGPPCFADKGTRRGEAEPPLVYSTRKRKELLRSSPNWGGGGLFY